MSEHTPGNWFVDENGDVVTDAGIAGNIVCEAPISWNESMEYWEANSSLLAAAPDLLAACEKALDCINGLYSFAYDRCDDPRTEMADEDADIAMLEAVIAKAKGQSSE